MSQKKELAKFNGTGLRKPYTRREWSRLGHVNASKMDTKRASRILINELQNFGMPVEVGVDIASHRLNIAFELPDSGKRVSKVLLKVYNFLGVSHRYVKCW